MSITSPPEVAAQRPTPGHRSGEGLRDKRDKWERRTAWPLAIIAVTTLIVFVMSAALDIRPPWQPVLDWTAWALFATDYLARLRLTPARQRWSWAKAHPLDLAAVALPALRVLRVIATLARLVVVAQRGRAERLMVTTVISALALTVVGAAAVLNAERLSADANITTYPDALWWALATVTTVGYGDYYPTTGDGRLIATVLMIVGIGVVGTVTASVATRLIGANSAQH